MISLVAAVDAPKWTDVASFAATAVQTVIVIVAAVVAYVQYRASVQSGRVQLTNDVIKELTDPALRDAIDRTSAHTDYRKDWPILTADLQLADGDPKRVQRENDLFAIANVFSRLFHLYDGNLIDRELFLNEFDEYTLFICGAVSGISKVYRQPDYRGLFELGAACQAHYKAHHGRYALLTELQIPVEKAGRSTQAGGGAP